MQTGKKNTIGIKGNNMTRNTNFLRQKIFLKIFKFFYAIQNNKLIKKIIKKEKKIELKNTLKIQQILKIFEQRFDIIIYRSNLIPFLFIIRPSIEKGYILLNLQIKTEIKLLLKKFDFIMLRKILRKYILKHFYLEKHLFSLFLYRFNKKNLLD
jgi:ribosomal protein S4